MDKRIRSPNSSGSSNKVVVLLEKQKSTYKTNIIKLWN